MFIRRQVKVVLMIIASVFISYVIYYHTVMPSSATVGLHLKWTLRNARKQNKRAEITLKPFVVAVGIETHLYSAIASYKKHKLKIIISTLDFTKGRSGFTCCLLLSNNSLLTVPAKFHYIHRHIKVYPSITQIFYPAMFDATQYNCELNQTLLNNVKVTRVSLSLSACTDFKSDYLPVVYQQQHPKDLAICAKVAFGDKLKASRLVEWFEMQKLLGVDKVLVYDLGCPENIQKVFNYYKKEGFLEIQPYSQPGEPKRGFKLSKQIDPQFSHDKQLTVFDCHERLGGYGYILAADFDEIILSPKYSNLKELIKHLKFHNPTAAGFVFHVQFHLETWGRLGNNTDIYFQQYKKATLPTLECKKYIYMPSRADTATIHAFKSRPPFKEHFVDPSIATVHHYRECPAKWKNCSPASTVVNQISKYESNHTKNTHAVFKKLGILSSDTVV